MQILRNEQLKHMLYNIKIGLTMNRQKIITKIATISLLVIFSTSVYSNPISFQILPANDYFRATAGEQLMFSNNNYKKNSIVVNNDLRYFMGTRIISSKGEVNKYNDYTRLINLFSIGYCPLNGIQFSIRVPYLSLFYNLGEDRDYSNKGLSDILVSLTVKLYGKDDVFNTYFLLGYKFSKGYYQFDQNDLKLVLGTGSNDIPILFRNDFTVGRLEIFFDVGYIIIGKSDGIFYLYEKNIDIGDEIFSDLAVIRDLNKSIRLKLELNWYSVFDPSVDIPIYRISPEQKKASICPGILWSPMQDDRILIDLSCSYDFWGRNTILGISPIIRFQYQR